MSPIKKEFQDKKKIFTFFLFGKQVYFLHKYHLWNWVKIKTDKTFLHRKNMEKKDFTCFHMLSQMEKIGFFFPPDLRSQKITCSDGLPSNANDHCRLLGSCLFSTHFSGLQILLSAKKRPIRLCDRTRMFRWTVWYFITCPLFWHHRVKMFPCSIFSGDRICPWLAGWLYEKWCRHGPIIFLCISQ